MIILPFTNQQNGWVICEAIATRLVELNLLSQQMAA